MAGHHVQRIDRPQRQRGDAVAHRDSRQPVGDRRQRHEPSGRVAAPCHTGRCQAPWFRNATSPAARSRWLRSIATCRPLRVIGVPSAQAIRSRPRSGLSGANTTPSTGSAPAEQRDRDGAAAAAFEVGTGAVMRIDHPAEAVRWRVQHAGFLADEAGGEQGGEAVAEEQLDLVIHRRGDVIGEARAGGAAEFGRDHPAGGFHRFDHVRQDGTRGKGHGCSSRGAVIRILARPRLAFAPCGGRRQPRAVLAPIAITQSSSKSGWLATRDGEERAQPQLSDHVPVAVELDAPAPAGATPLLPGPAAA